MRLFILLLVLAFIFGCASSEKKVEQKVIAVSEDDLGSAADVRMPDAVELPGLETFNESETAQIADNRFPVYYFYSLECPYCARIKPKIDELEAKYNSSVHFERHNVLLQDELEIYDNFTARYNVSSRVVPLVFVNDSYLSGMFEINDSLESLIIANTNISP